MMGIQWTLVGQVWGECEKEPGSDVHAREQDMVSCTCGSL